MTMNNLSYLATSMGNNEITIPKLQYTVYIW